MGYDRQMGTDEVVVYRHGDGNIHDRESQSDAHLLEQSRNRRERWKRSAVEPRSVVDGDHGHDSAKFKKSQGLSEKDGRTALYPKRRLAMIVRLHAREYIIRSILAGLGLLMIFR